MITLGYLDMNDGGEKLDQYIKGFDIDKHYYSYDYNMFIFLSWHQNLNLKTALSSTIL
ncbi:MAG TPA: hypothetical protein VIP70_08405 [Nitrososphaeraceae archaeon]